MSISSRQQQLLISIIKEFIDTAEAVGSISLQNKYNFRVSPATIRNEMSDLVDEGYLFQKHNSGGRIPTTKGWRFFIDQAVDSQMQDLDFLTKESIKSDLYKAVANKNMLIEQAIQHLSRLTQNATVALIEKDVYYAGLSEMINLPEFREYESLRRILKLLEDYTELSRIMNKGNPENDLNILIGEETENSEFADCAVIFSEIRLDGNEKGYIAVIGPNRMRYDLVIPVMKYLVDTVREILKN